MPPTAAAALLGTYIQRIVYDFRQCHDGDITSRAPAWQMMSDTLRASQRVYFDVASCESEPSTMVTPQQRSRQPEYSP